MILTPCRDATPDELPRTATTLLKAALAAGWTARATYAKALVRDVKRTTFAYDDHVTRNGVTGRVRDVHRDKVHLGILVDGLGYQRIDVWEIAETGHLDDQEAQGTVSESVAVRLRRWPLAAAGLWREGKFAHAYVWSPWTVPNKVGARQLSKFVKGES